MRNYVQQMRCVVCGLLLGLLCDSVAYGGCSVSATSINFGSYDFSSTLPVSGTGTITLSCSNQSTVTIAIGASSNSGGFQPRMMQHSALPDTLEYTIFTSAAMAQVWGDGTRGTRTLRVTNVKKYNAPITLYGELAPLQNVSPGIYTEQLLVTILF
jgi:spore coat protein U-like protein